MEFFDPLSKNAKKLLILIYQKGGISSKEQNIYSILSFYNIMSTQLVNLGLVTVIRNKNENVWTLTEKGKKIAKLLIEYSNILKNG